MSVRGIRVDTKGRPIPPLSDIPGRLRWMADAIEDGSWVTDDELRSIVFVEYMESGEVTVGCIGATAPVNKAEIVGVLALAMTKWDARASELVRGDFAFGEAATVTPFPQKETTHEDAGQPGEPAPDDRPAGPDGTTPG